MTRTVATSWRHETGPTARVMGRSGWRRMRPVINAISEVMPRASRSRVRFGTARRASHHDDDAGKAEPGRGQGREARRLAHPPPCNGGGDEGRGGMDDGDVGDDDACYAPVAALRLPEGCGLTPGSGDGAHPRATQPSLERSPRWSRTRSTSMRSSTTR